MRPSNTVSSPEPIQAVGGYRVIPDVNQTGAALISSQGRFTTIPPPPQTSPPFPNLKPQPPRDYGQRVVRAGACLGDDLHPATPGNHRRERHLHRHLRLTVHPSRDSSPNADPQLEVIWVGPLVSGTGSLVSWDKNGSFVFEPATGWSGEHKSAIWQHGWVGCAWFEGTALN